MLAAGVKAPAALLILDGQVVVNHGTGSQTVTLERLGAGDFYATRGMLRNEASRVRLQAISEVRALAIPVVPLQTQLAHSPLLARDIETVLEARGQAQEKLARVDRNLRVA